MKSYSYGYLYTLLTKANQRITIIRNTINKHNKHLVADGFFMTWQVGHLGLLD